jgi:hypothetical protein
MVRVTRSKIIRPVILEPDKQLQPITGESPWPQGSSCSGRPEASAASVFSSRLSIPLLGSVRFLLQRVS